MRMARHGRRERINGGSRYTTSQLAEPSKGLDCGEGDKRLGNRAGIVPQYV